MQSWGWAVFARTALALSVATAPGRGQTSRVSLGILPWSLRHERSARPLLCFFTTVLSRASPAGYPGSADLDASDYRRASKTGQVGHNPQAAPLRSAPLLTSLSPFRCIPPDPVVPDFRCTPERRRADDIPGEGRIRLGCSPFIVRCSLFICPRRNEQ